MFKISLGTCRSLNLSFVYSTGNCADQPMCHHLERNSGAQSTWTIPVTSGCSSHMLALIHAISNICQLSQTSNVIINCWTLHSVDRQFKSPSPYLCCKDSYFCRIFPLSHTGFFLSIYFCLKPYSSFWTGLWAHPISGIWLCAVSFCVHSTCQSL